MLTSSGKSMPQVTFNSWQVIGEQKLRRHWWQKERKVEDTVAQVNGLLLLIVSSIPIGGAGQNFGLEIAKN